MREQAGGHGLPLGPGGLVGVFETLVRQHRQLRESLRSASEPQPPSERRARWIKARRELLSHERAEVLEVYPALEGYDDSRDIIEHHEKQAAELESIAADIDALDFESSAEQCSAKLQELAALLEEHAEQEENVFFPRAQRLLGEASSRELAERFAGVQQEALERLV